MKYLTGLYLLGMVTLFNISDAATAENNAQPATTNVAIFAGGCFWCMESDFEKIVGVTRVVSGYTGGHTKNPSYREVSAGGTGHAEAVRIEYDSSKVSYSTLLNYFWKNIDPVTDNAQFCDHGSQYRAAIFYLNDAQEKQAKSSKQNIQASGKLTQPITTKIVKASTFYPAETYHQDYYKKNPIRYHLYRYNCGRDKRLERLWGE